MDDPIPTRSGPKKPTIKSAVAGRRLKAPEETVQIIPQKKSRSKGVGVLTRMATGKKFQRPP